jgi:hypothetical protein
MRSTNSRRILPFLAMFAVVAAYHASAQGGRDEPAVTAWIAPPYWSRPVPQPEVAEAGGREALASGRQALTGGAVALPFIALPPCRLVDTRGNAPLTGGFLPAATIRSYTLTGVCGVPANAQAISLNATVTDFTGPGFLTMWPEGGPFPPVSTLNYLAGQTVVNAAVVPLSATGGISIALGVTGGDVILDTNGYYAQVPDVSSLNTLAGDVTIATGGNLTLTPAGNTLTLGTAATIAANLTGNVTGSVAGAASENVLKSGDTMIADLAFGPGNVNLVTEPSTAASGNILKNGSRFLHDFGVENTFLGIGSGNFAMTGSGNTGVGFQTLAFLTTGGANTAVGDHALWANRSGLNNTAVGYAALPNDTTGSQNTAVGTVALDRNTAGSDNTASGFEALFSNTTGNGNTAVGFDALKANTAGFSNTASGGSTLLSNTTGYGNTADGAFALQNTTTGNGNTAGGYAALSGNTTGEYNTASGLGALSGFGGVLTGSYNTASGYDALGGATTGSYDTAIGNNALVANTTGSDNTAAGDSAGTGGTYTGYAGAPVSHVGISTGSYNTFLGAQTGATLDSRNCTAIGTQAYCDGNDQVRLGNFYVTSIGGAVAWSALSDARAKKDVRDLSLGLDFVMALRPVEYRLTNGNERVDLGFVAQDVEALLGEGYDVVDVGRDAERTLSLRYTELIAPLVKAVQEQQRVIRRLGERLERAEAQLVKRPD